MPNQNLVKIEIPELPLESKDPEETEEIIDIEDINKSFCSCKNCQD